jgi:hypothetical protein
LRRSKSLSFGVVAVAVALGVGAAGAAPIIVSTTQTEVTIGGLSCGTQYRIRVKVAGDSAVTTLNPVTKPCPPPEPPPPPPPPAGQPPPPPPPPEGTIAFQDNFETAQILGPTTFSGWAWMQPSCDATGANPKIAFVPGYRAGSTAVQMKAVSGVNSSCELSDEVFETPSKIGTTDFLAQRFRFPAPFFSPTCCQTIITQHGYQSFRFANLFWGAGYGSTSLDLVAQNGLWSNGAYEHLLWHKPIDAIRENIWHELIVEVKWATRPKGVFRVWHRLAGEMVFALVHEEINIPTLQWGDHAPDETLLGGWRCIDVNGYGSPAESPTCNPDRPSTMFSKIGMYSGAPSGSPDRVVQHDVFVKGTTFAAVAAHLDAN